MSGILLGKSMGRSSELADRFERESGRLATLEVRSRMAGRWMMATIQTSFAVMPALVYLFAGLTPGAVTIGTLVAFTTLQTRLFWPIQSLLNVGVDIQTFGALFERVFEYLDLPVDIPRARGPSRTARRRGPRRRVVPLRPGRGDVDAGRRRPRPAGRHADGDRRRDRCRQDDARLPRRPPLRPGARRGADRRDRRARPHLREPRRHRRHRVAGDPPLPRLRPRGPALRPAGRHGRGGSRTLRAPPRSTTSSPGCPTRRDGRRRARLPLLRRGEAAHRRSRARSCATRRCSSSTRPRARSTSRRSARWRRRSSAWPRDGPRSSSRTASRPCAAPTRSSCSTAAPWPSAARTTSCSRTGGRYAAMVARDAAPQPV